MLGIVFFAVAAKKTLAHPEDALSRPGRAALGLGVFLYLGGFVAARYRIVRTIGRERAAAAVLALVVVVALRSIDAVALFAVVTAIVIVATVVERVRYKRAPSPIMQE